jgi:hypothetical protein
MNYIYDTGEIKFSYDFSTGIDCRSVLQMACSVFSVLRNVLDKKPKSNVTDAVITGPVTLAIIWNTNMA